MDDYARTLKGASAYDGIEESTKVDREKKLVFDVAEEEENQQDEKTDEKGEDLQKENKGVRQQQQIKHGGNSRSLQVVTEISQAYTGLMVQVSRFLF